VTIFNSFLAQYWDSLISTINQVFLERKTRIENSELSHAHDMLSEFCTRGKMIRGNLLILTHNTYNGKNLQSAIQLGAAIEIIHSGALIHDDIMDNDEIRRGKPSLYASYVSHGKQSGIRDFNEYGRSIALVLGDYAFFIAKEIFARIEVDEETYRRIQLKFAETLQKVILGQFLDYDFGKKAGMPTDEDILEMYALKTASYSISLPLVLGGYLAHASEKDINLLDEFGKNLGIAFQIQDDVIGLLSTEKDTGKPIGSDIRENKKTLIRAFLEKEVKGDDKKILDALFKKSIIREEDIKKVIDMVSKYHIDKKIADIIESLSKKAHERMSQLSINSEYKTLFSKFIEYNQHRRS